MIETWSFQLHNAKAVLQQVRLNMGKMDEEVKRNLVPMMHVIKESEDNLRSVEFGLDVMAGNAVDYSKVTKPRKQIL